MLLGRYTYRLLSRIAATVIRCLSPSCAEKISFTFADLQSNNILYLARK